MYPQREVRTDAAERLVCEWGLISGGVVGSIAGAGSLILIADDLRRRAALGPVLVDGVRTTYAAALNGIAAHPARR